MLVVRPFVVDDFAVVQQRSSRLEIDLAAQIAPAVNRSRATCGEGRNRRAGGFAAFAMGFLIVMINDEPVLANLYVPRR
jgi:hypothetical protein